MWVVLSFTACLVATPDHCEPRELAYSADYMTQKQCENQAVALLAQWAGRHPRWRISGSYGCSTKSERELKA